MIMDKGSFAWNIDRTYEIIEKDERIEQLEEYIKKKGLKVPKKKKPKFLQGGYNTDDEE